MATAKTPRKPRAIQTPGETAVDAAIKSTTQADETNQANEPAETIGGLPDADDIDASTIISAVLTKQGWLLPNGGADNVQ